MKNKYLWWTIFSLGLLMVVFDLMWVYLMAKTSIFGMNIHCISIINGNKTIIDFVIPSIKGGVLAAIGFFGVFITSKGGTGKV